MLTRSTILDHVLDPTGRGLNPDLACYLFNLDFPAADHSRYELLAEKAQLGTLTEQDQSELDDFLNVNAFLTVVRARAVTRSLSSGGCITHFPPG